MDIFRILGSGIKFNHSSSKQSNASLASKIISPPVVTDVLNPELDFFNAEIKVSKDKSKDHIQIEDGDDKGKYFFLIPSWKSGIG